MGRTRTTKKEKLHTLKEARAIVAFATLATEEDGSPRYSHIAKKLGLSSEAADVATEAFNDDPQRDDEPDWSPAQEERALARIGDLIRAETEMG